MKRAFSRLAIAALFALGAAAAVHAKPLKNQDEEAPKPLPPLQKNFPLDQTWSLRELNGKPVPATWTSASRSTARCTARVSRAAIPGRR